MAKLTIELDFKLGDTAYFISNDGVIVGAKVVGVNYETRKPISRKEEDSEYVVYELDYKIQADNSSIVPGQWEKEENATSNDFRLYKSPEELIKAISKNIKRD